MQQMDYNTILELYDYFNYFSNELLTCINNIKNIVNDLDKNEHWDGNGYKEYNEKMSNLSANFSAYISDIGFTDDEAFKLYDKLTDYELFKGNFESTNINDQVK